MNAIKAHPETGEPYIFVTGLHSVGGAMPLAELQENLPTAQPEVRTPDDDAPLWWSLTSDEALLREALPDHRPEYC